jgi:ABC-type transport system involved in cytochrome c biogenesis permease subunit
MTLAGHATYLFGLIFYIAGGVCALHYLRRGNETLLRTIYRALVASALLFMAAVFARGYVYGGAPLTTVADALNLLTILTTVITLGVTRVASVRSLLGYYAPALAGLSIIAGLAGYRDLHVEPKPINEVFLVTHVGLAFLAYALFVVAALTSVAYFLQSRNLKRLNTTGLFHRLPALEQLDRTLFRLISLGYPLFVVTLILGLVWTFLDRNQLGPHWWMSPKIARSIVMVVLYGVAFHARSYGLLRGEKLALLVVVGVSALLASYMVLGLANLQDYNFWGDAA